MSELLLNITERAIICPNGFEAQFYGTNVSPKHPNPEMLFISLMRSMAKFTPFHPSAAITIANFSFMYTI